MNVCSRVSAYGSLRLFAACVLAAATVGAQTPTVVNGTLESRTSTQPLAREIATITSAISGPAWIGYAVPVNRADRETGCWACERGLVVATMPGDMPLIVAHNAADGRE